MDVLGQRYGPDRAPWAWNPDRADHGRAHDKRPTRASNEQTSCTSKKKKKEQTSCSNALPLPRRTRAALRPPQRLLGLCRSPTFSRGCIAIAKPNPRWKNLRRLRVCGSLSSSRRRRWRSCCRSCPARSRATCASTIASGGRGTGSVLLHLRVRGTISGPQKGMSRLPQPGFHIFKIKRDRFILGPC